MKNYIRELAGVSLLAMLSITAGHGVAHAQRVSSMQAGKLLQYCTRSSGVQICEGYIAGMADGVALTKVFDKNEGDSKAPAGFCIPSSVTGTQLRESVVVWMKKHTDQLHHPVGAAVYTALHETFPCQGKAEGSKDHS